MPEASRNQPGGFNDHGFPQVDTNHGLGGIGGVSWSTRVPLTLLGTTGDNAAVFRDNADPFDSSRNLGTVQLGTGGVGIGSGGIFVDGVTTFADADVLPDPTASFPTLRNVVSGTARNLTARSASSTDAIFKARQVICPHVGSCTTGGEQCARDTDCPTPGDICDNIALTCATPSVACGFLGGDADGDGICDDGDGSGISGDNPCTGGATTGCDDNCVFRFDPLRIDRGGQASAAPDGIGDACQCGDMNNDGKVSNTDRLILNRFIGGLPPGIQNVCRAFVGP